MSYTCVGNISSPGGFGKKLTSLSSSFICKLGIIITNDSNFFIGMPWRLNELMHITHLLRTMPGTQQVLHTYSTELVVNTVPLLNSKSLEAPPLVWVPWLL